MANQGMYQFAFDGPQLYRTVAASGSNILAIRAESNIVYGTYMA